MTGDKNVFIRRTRGPIDDDLATGDRNVVRSRGSDIAGEVSYVTKFTVTEGEWIDIGTFYSAPNPRAKLIYGNIVDDLAVGIESVKITVTGDYYGSGSADIFGDYAVSIFAGTYTITPSKDGYIFTPSVQVITDANIEIDFVGTRVAVDGSIVITGGGGDLEGVTVAMTDESDETTDVNGDYSFAPVLDGAKIITPTMIGYEFAPVDIDITIDRAHSTGNDFIATSTGSQFTNRRVITIDKDKVPGNLTDFPVIIKITGINTNNIRADGQDVVIYLDDDTTRLPVEIGNHTAGTLVIYTKVPALSASVDTVLYMYYNSPSYEQPAVGAEFGKYNVWNTDFKFVWHGRYNDDDVTITDSTSGISGSAAGSTTPPYETSGVVDVGMRFPAADISRIAVDADASFITTVATLAHYWSRAAAGTLVSFVPTPGGGEPIIRTDSGNAFRLRGNDDASTFFWIDTNQPSSNSAYGAGVYGGGSRKIYVNGVEGTDTPVPGTGILSNDATQIVIGTLSGDSGNNVIEEVRYSVVERTANWLLTESNNITSIGTFHTTGVETGDSKSGVE